MIKNLKQGFTLIEMLVVVSIIGLLASFMYARFSTSEKIARDTRRKSDLGQYRIALENYAVVHGGLYVMEIVGGASGVDAVDVLCPNLQPTYLSACPADPRRGTTDFDYKYESNWNATDYVLWGKMETGLGFWVICSNGKVGEASSACGSACPPPSCGPS